MEIKRLYIVCANFHYIQYGILLFSIKRKLSSFNAFEYVAPRAKQIKAK